MPVSEGGCTCIASQMDDSKTKKVRSQILQLTFRVERLKTQMTIDLRHPQTPKAGSQERNNFCFFISIRGKCLGEIRNGCRCRPEGAHAPP